MGASGAGKTTLLNCLSERVTTGVISDGVRMVNGHSLDSSFQSLSYGGFNIKFIKSELIFTLDNYYRKCAEVLKS